MIFPVFRRRPRFDNITALYGAIVAQARRPAFYTELRVPDTLDGRFELIVLHLALVLRRLGLEGRTLGQALFDRFCADMDANLRELGVGDLTVPREMKRMGEAFYGRLAAYDTAFAQGGDRLAATLARNVFATAPAEQVGALARYVTAAWDDLAARELAELQVGTLRFPDPLIGVDTSQARGLEPRNLGSGGLGQGSAGA